MLSSEQPRRGRRSTFLSGKLFIVIRAAVPGIAAIDNTIRGSMPLNNTRTHIFPQSFEGVICFQSGHTPVKEPLSGTYVTNVLWQRKSR